MNEAESNNNERIPPAETQPSSRKSFRFPPLGWLGWVAEMWFAGRMSRQLRRLYERVLEDEDEPELARMALYEQVVIQWSGLDRKGAAGILRRAEQSFCAWPSDRDLRFRELVQYLVIHEYLRSHAAALGTRTNMLRTVARVIPETL